MTSPPTGLPDSLGLHSQLLDLDPSETQEWLESLDQVVNHAGRNRARGPTTWPGAHTNHPGTGDSTTQ
jgi:hypothetical protein